MDEAQQNKIEFGYMFVARRVINKSDWGDLRYHHCNNPEGKRNEEEEECGEEWEEWRGMWRGGVEG